jgi:hypothetical protein
MPHRLGGKRRRCIECIDRSPAKVQPGYFAPPPKPPVSRGDLAISIVALVLTVLLCAATAVMSALIVAFVIGVVAVGGVVVGYATAVG